MLSAPEEIGRVLDSALADDPTRPAVTARAGTLSYAELDERSNRWARVLREHGVKPGDRVGVSLPNDLDIVAAFHGAMRLGAVWVGINEGLAGPEKAYMLEDSRAMLLLCGADTAAQLERAGPPTMRTMVVSGAGAEEWVAALAAQDAAPLGNRVDPFAPAGIAYTSGTTGFPKGVVHSQSNMLMPGAYLNATRGYGADLCKGDCFPLTILNMLILTTLLTAQAGGHGVIMDKISTESVCRWVREEEVSVWNGPPPVLYTLAHDDRVLPTDLVSLREVWAGGADLPRSIRAAFEAKFGIEVRSTYGLTEAPTVVAIERPGAAHAEGSSGFPLPHLEVTIRDRDGATLPVGEVGQVCISPRAQGEIPERFPADWNVELEAQAEPPTYRPMLGYWEKNEASEAALGQGYLRTGDAGSFNAAGELLVSDRINLVLNRGGANVYPAETERVVAAFESVDSCGVFGVADDRLGERVAMLVQFDADAEPDLDALLDHCRVELAAYKVPELVAVVDELPRNAMGKIDRRRLAEIGAPLVGRYERGRVAT